MRVLLLGGTGNISTSLTRQLVAAGHETWLVNRGKRNPIPGTRQVQADTNDEVALTAATAGMTFDAVLDFIAFKPTDSERDARVFAGRTSQYIFISSASVYQKPLASHLVTESTPLVNPYWDYSRDKIACEEACLSLLRSQGFPAVIVRPSLTYDTVIPTALGGWTDFTVVDRIKRGVPVVVHGDGSSLWTITHADDFCSALFGLLGNPATIGEAFHITSDEVLTWDEIYREIGRAVGVPTKLVHVPSDLIAAVEPWHRGNLHGDKSASVVFDNSKIKRFVPGWQARIPWRVGIRRTIAWYEADAARQVINAGNNAFLDRCIAAMTASYTAIGKSLPVTV
jgi:nucleoside-diphosphate-sugar epimerase